MTKKQLDLIRRAIVLLQRSRFPVEEVPHNEKLDKAIKLLLEIKP